MVTYFCRDSREGRYDGAFETSFKVEKNDGFGLEHTFCNDETAGRNYHIFMQFAYVHAALFR